MHRIVRTFVVVLALVAAVRSDEKDALTTWLRAGGAIFDKIDIKEFDNYGRGLVATADIQVKRPLRIVQYLLIFNYTSRRTQH
jgi:hypothetical protein